MRAIFLRGAVPPTHEHPEKLLYNTIDECEDVWTQLFHTFLVRTGSNGELLYQGQKKIFNVDNFLTEVWTGSFKEYIPKFEPDVIISRGGFEYYDDLIKRFPKTRKVYYGAGTRFFPQTKFKDYDLVLVDSERQLEKVRSMGWNAEYLLKPAARLFIPSSVEKKFDICFMSNNVVPDMKGLALLISSLKDSKLSMRVIGKGSKQFEKMAKTAGVRVDLNDWVFRKDLPDIISSCRVGVCPSTEIDSCPRVIPEFLACGLPVVVTSDVHFWKELYMTKETGNIAEKTHIVSAVKNLLKSETLRPREYYEEHLSVEKAADRLAEQVRGIL